MDTLVIITTKIWLKRSDMVLNFLVKKLAVYLIKSCKKFCVCEKERKWNFLFGMINSFHYKCGKKTIERESILIIGFD